SRRPPPRTPPPPATTSAPRPIPTCCWRCAAATAPSATTPRRATATSSTSSSSSRPRARSATPTCSPSTAGCSSKDSRLPMETPRHTYRKFVFAAASRTAAGHYSVTSPRHGRAFRLEPAEFELARLFDGDRDPAQLAQSAARLFGREFGAAELEQFANELALAGLLLPGTRQPLPVPPQSDEEAAAAGWLGQRPAPGGPEIAPPSAVPGSLSGGGRMGTLTTLWGAFRGQSEPVRQLFP